MNKPKVRSNINHIIEIADSFLRGKNTINKMNNDSGYQEHTYTPEVVLEHIKDSAKNALKGLDEYE